MDPCINREQLRRLLDGQLGEVEGKAVEAHLEACAPCQKTFEELVADDGADLAGWIDRLPVSGPVPPAQPTTDFPSPPWSDAPPATLRTPDLQSGNETDGIQFPDPATARGPLGRLESYHIMAELGQGAYGCVFKAYDERLGCLVALKVLRPELAAESRARIRFEGEARNIAAVRHDHVVTIHHVGSTPGFALPYFVMEYLDGGSLDARLEREKTLEPREAAEVIRQAACGVAAAHARGLVHRDLKPSNMLLEKGSGRVKITDFGLARELDADRTRMTLPGAILGTPPYMSPEQILMPDQIGPRSDVYSLGAVLYELLTGQPPFRGATHLILQQVVLDEPHSPRRLDDRIPRDLETICLKCLHKEPRRRYQSAEELTTRLQMFLDGRPIPDRPVGRPERLGRWCRRNPAQAVLTGSVVLLLVLIVVGSLFTAQQARKGQRQAEDAEATIRKERDRGEELLEQVQSEKEKSDRLWDSYLTQARAVRHGHQAGQRFKSLEALSQVARQRPSLELRNEAIAFMTMTDLQETATHFPARAENWYGRDFDPALKHFAFSDPQGTISVRRIADNQEVDSWPSPGGPAWVVRFSPDGRFLAAKYHPRGEEHDPQSVQSHVRDLKERKTVLKVPLAMCERACAFCPDSRRLAVGGLNGEVHLCDLSGGGQGKPLAQVPIPTCLAFRPGGRELAVFSARDREIQVLDVNNGTILGRLPVSLSVVSLTWHPEGKRLAAVCGRYPDAEFPVYIWDTTAPWDASARREPHVLRGHGSEVQYVAFSHNGDLLVTSSWDETTRLWDPWTGRHLVSALTGEARVQFRPDDQVLGTISSKGLRLWDVATGRECRALHGHTGHKGPWGVDYSPDGRLLASAGADGVRLWDTEAAREIAFLPGERMESALFHPKTGASLIACGNSGVHRWPITRAPEDPSRDFRIGPHRRLVADPCNKACLAPDGRLLLVTDRTGQVLVLDLENPAAPGRAEAVGTVDLVTISPNGKWAAFSTYFLTDARNAVRVYEMGTWKLVKELAASQQHMAFSPDGHWLVTNTAVGESVFKFQDGTWEASHTIRTGAKVVRRPHAFAPGGKLLALTVDPRSVRLVDPPTGREIATLTAPDPQQVSWLCFSPDGSQLAVATENHVIHLWDLRRIVARLAEMNLDWDRPSY